MLRAKVAPASTRTGETWRRVNKLLRAAYAATSGEKAGPSCNDSPAELASDRGEIAAFLDAADALFADPLNVQHARRLLALDGQVMAHADGFADRVRRIAEAVLLEQEPGGYERERRECEARASEYRERSATWRDPAMNRELIKKLVRDRLDGSALDEIKLTAPEKVAMLEELRAEYAAAVSPQT